MKPIEAWQVKAIYALGGSLGMVERNNHDDPLHQLVCGITGKAEIKSLDMMEAGKVLYELKERMRLGNQATVIKPPKKHPTTQGGMTDGQQRKVWHLMYQLAELDTQRSKSSLGERLCGIIKRQFQLDAAPTKPFQWLTYSQGDKLIEIVKKYVATATEKRMRGESG